MNQRVDRLEGTLLDICSQMDSLVTMITGLQKELVWTNKQKNLIQIEVSFLILKNL